MSIFRRHPPTANSADPAAAAREPRAGDAARAAPTSPAARSPHQGRPDGPGSGELSQSARGRVTQIAPGTRFQGEVSGSTELHIMGDVTGEVRVEALVVVGAEGRVQGPVYGRVVRVVGKVIGNVRAAELVELGPASSLDGDIAAPRVVIAEGAFFKGKVEMKDITNRGDHGPQPQPPPAGGGGGADKASSEAGSD
ncbi:MAG TPA: polymer-forming cytoskeletal protein [Thermoanaerobaculia bacterium]|nr:polymer-forming cytoskeletal protein [Thermoanaerobaculia bacterium]